MKVVLFGASGMIGQGVLRECLLDPEVESVVAIVRSATGQSHPKLREVVHRDFTDFSGLESDLSGQDACFFCLGVSSVGMKEADYRRVTYDFTMAAARLLARLNSGMTFVFVSGAGTDSSERGRSTWARVKGQTDQMQRTKVAYSGSVFVDRQLHTIARITHEALNIAPSFPIRGASETLDYDFIKIGVREYFLPLAATLQMQVQTFAGKVWRKNEKEFRLYRKYSADAVIKFDAEEPPPQP
jgi:hypothetical protein